MNILNRLPAKPLTLTLLAAALLGAVGLGLLAAQPTRA